MLAYVDPKYVTPPIPNNARVNKGADGNMLTDENIANISNEMKKMIDDKKTLYMTIQTHGGLLEEPSELFENMPIYPEWVTESKLM